MKIKGIFTIVLFLFIGLCPICGYALSYYTSEEYPGSMLVEGIFEEGDIETFKQHVTEMNINDVILNSAGGNMMAGIEIGIYMRENNISTVLPENAICFSACSYAFMGGKERAINSNAQFAMHRPYFAKEMKGTHNEGYNSGIITSVIVVSYLIEMGLDPLTASSHLLNEELAHFSVAQQKELNIITASDQ